MLYTLSISHLCIMASFAMTTLSALANDLPSLTPTATATASAAPGKSHSLPAPTPAPTVNANGTLVQRCGDRDCTYGSGGESTLQASIVTSTIVSTTSVPCYITTYVTDSTTITSTVYSTEVITSTVTSEGTVFIIQYSPTPTLMSTLVESVIEITESWLSYWTTQSGSAYQITSSVDGGITAGGDGSDSQWNNDGGASSSSKGAGWDTSGSGSGSGGSSASAIGSQSAWTHIGDNAVASGVATSKVGVANGWSTGTAAVRSGYGSGTVNWSAAQRHAGLAGWDVVCFAILGVGAVILWEIVHFILYCN